MTTDTTLGLKLNAHSSINHRLRLAKLQRPPVGLENDCSFSEFYCCPGEEVKKEDALGSNCRSRAGTACRFSEFGCCPYVDMARVDNVGSNCDVHGRVSRYRAVQGQQEGHTYDIDGNDDSSPEHEAFMIQTLK